MVARTPTFLNTVIPLNTLYPLPNNTLSLFLSSIVSTHSIAVHLCFHMTLYSLQQLAPSLIQQSLISHTILCLLTHSISLFNILNTLIIFDTLIPLDSDNNSCLPSQHTTLGHLVLLTPTPLLICSLFMLRSDTSRRSRNQSSFSRPNTTCNTSAPSSSPSPSILPPHLLSSLHCIYLSTTSILSILVSVFFHRQSNIITSLLIPITSFGD